MPNNTLYVLPTSRARRERSGEFSVGKRFLTMEEFEQRLIYAEDRAMVDKTARLLALKAAAERLKNAEKLHISKDFLVFLDHAEFFLKFFDEIALENANINDLLIGDFYAEYDEHIKVLNDLQNLYYEELAKKRFYDRGFLARNYIFNLDWLGDFSEIIIEVEGALTKHEITLLTNAANFAKTTIKFAETPFDEQILSAIAPLKERANVEIEKLNLDANFRLFFVKERLEQIAAIQSEVFYYIENHKIEPEKIVVVLPDEKFAGFMQRFDEFRLFNYAMGFAFTETKFYRLLSAFAERKNNKIAQIYLDRAKLPEIKNFNDVLQLANESEREIAKDAFDEVKPILDSFDLSFDEAISLYLQTLAKKTFDDFSGGKITVLGALETRSAKFDVAIVVDFNDEVVPHKSEKDMFLNALVRNKAGLPNYIDRADNERAIYFRLFSRVKFATILCVKNDEKNPSRFIKELNLKEPLKSYEYDKQIFFPQANIKKQQDEEIVLDINLPEPLSATKLKTYLTCKRKFYYQYIKGLKENPAIRESVISHEVGVILHNALAKNLSYNDTIEFIKKSAAGDQRLLFETRLWEARLKSFFMKEIERKNEGWIHIESELNLDGEFNGIKLEGRIDRIDRKDDQFVILDYKSKTPKNDERDFQLLIYKLLYAQKAKGEILTGYYDLSAMKINLVNTHENLEIFTEKINEYKSPLQNFVQTEKKSDCIYCQYKILCGKER
ncbi:MAG: PD-(D/E)XK nuclease family protein [Helicobacteraceae bacterium]|jgi:CRISPR/Cas system-associated exonuclease Cas4 (RecB family)|nr:PD-(D/E)XK nuclease family protein [Helicobacteraceae bacterium]